MATDRTMAAWSSQGESEAINVSVTRSTKFEPFRPKKAQEMDGQELREMEARLPRNARLAVRYLNFGQTVLTS